MRVAIMQPYFFPYAGYFRLFTRADLFVVLDTVQFPRRGWVHRNRLLNATGEPAWVTLPLARSPRHATIAEQRFSDDAAGRLRARLRSFPVCDGGAAESRFTSLFDCDERVVDYLVRQLRGVCELLGITTPLVEASGLDINPALRGANRLRAIAHAVGADTYVNAPGGRMLYDAAEFERDGIDLEFLPDYAGNRISVLQRLLTEPLDKLRAQII